MRRKDKEAS